MIILTPALARRMLAAYEARQLDDPGTKYHTSLLDVALGQPDKPYVLTRREFSAGFKRPNWKHEKGVDRPARAADTSWLGPKP